MYISILFQTESKLNSFLQDETQKRFKFEAMDKVYRGIM